MRRMRIKGQLFGRFARDNRAVAAVEFALILPFLLLLYFGTVEAAALYTADRRVYTIAGTMGDLVSRVDGTINQSTLNDYFAAAQTIMRPYATTNLEQVVSVVSVSNSGVVTVDWSRGYNGGTKRADGSIFPLADTSEFNRMARGKHLVISEISYSYTPLLGMVLSGPVPLDRTQYFMPRYDDAIAYDANR